MISFGLPVGLWILCDFVILGWLKVALFSKWYLKSCIHFNILTVVTECNFHWTSTTSGLLRLIRIISKVVKEVIGHWMALHSVWWNRENSSVWGCSWHSKQWGQDEMDNISQMTYSNVFSSMKMFEFQLKFQWGLFLRDLLTIFQHWFR